MTGAEKNPSGLTYHLNICLGSDAGKMLLFKNHWQIAKELSRTDLTHNRSGCTQILADTPESDTIHSEESLHIFMYLHNKSTMP